VLDSQGYMGFKEDWGRRLSSCAARGYSEEGAKDRKLCQGDLGLRGEGFLYSGGEERHGCRGFHGQGRGRGIREEQWGEAPGWWNPWFPPMQQGFPNHFHPQYGYYPTPPLIQIPSLGNPFLGPQQGRRMQQPLFKPRQRPHQQQGNRHKGPMPRKRQDADKPKEGVQPQVQDNKAVKLSNVTCYNCAEWDHFSIDCKQPKLCFICQTSDHVGRDCPEWMKPLEHVQYLGSATQGLSFFHVEVKEEANRAG
jgi:hypothetical protein